MPWFGGHFITATTGAPSSCSDCERHDCGADAFPVNAVVKHSGQEFPICQGGESTIVDQLLKLTSSRAGHRADWEPCVVRNTFHWLLT